MANIKIENCTSGEVGYSLPSRNVRRIWLPFNFLNVAEDEVQEALYQPGVEILFSYGMLKAEDCPAARKLGLIKLTKEELQKGNENIVSPIVTKKVITKAQALKILQGDETVAVETIKQASSNSLDLLKDAAIENRIVTAAIVDALEECTGIDVLDAISQKKKLGID